ncbi:MAG: polysulfide reductase NrfD [Pseudomonadales bacterium]|nr:polysulfide reductase NrfD [Pseudomonadales bacterium]
MGHEFTWHLPVIFYLYLAGLGAGAVSVSGYAFLNGERSPQSSYHYFRMARLGAIIGPIPVLIGVALLIFELGRPFRPLNLYKVINLSPMSIGSWFLLFFILTSLAWTVTFLASFKPEHEGLHKKMAPARTALAMINIPLGIGVAVYTGILLGAMPARPFWNSPILAFLFLISALSTGIALIVAARALFHRKSPEAVPDRRERTAGRRKSKRAGRRYHETGYLLATTDLVLISLELLVIFLFIMFAHLTIGNLKYAMQILLPGGEMAMEFWVGVVLVGLLIPALVELYTCLPRMLYNVPFVAHRSVELCMSIAVLIGGFMLRYVIVIAGQITGPLGI